MVGTALPTRESCPHVIALAQFNNPKDTTLSVSKSPRTRKKAEAAPDAAKATAKPDATPSAAASPDPLELARLVAQQLDDDKAENILNIPLAGKSPMADAMVVASGRSARHVAARRGFDRHHALPLPGVNHLPIKPRSSVERQGRHR